MTGQKERSIEELYRDDPESADALVFGRETGPSRRGFLGGAGLATMCTAVGATIPYSDDMPAGLIPAAMAQSAAPPPASTPATPKAPQFLKFPGKNEKLVLLGEKPLVAETPESLLDDATTRSTNFMFATMARFRRRPRTPTSGKSLSTARSTKSLS